jgi:acetoin utilization deacetylase AcuC-like enzyme
MRRGIAAAGLEPRLELCRPRSAATAELLRVHTAAHLSRVAAARGRHVRFDADTQAGPRSYEAALLAAGAVIEAVERTLEGHIQRALCAVRPPGHHAESDRAMGFCLFNNVAAAAAHALAKGLERIAVVDFDVHHGNGTQAIFYRDPRVLYVSSHAYPFYPGTGALSELGTGPGQGFTVNLPLPPGMGDAEYARVYREIVEPILSAFDPELVLVSAGFDPHRDDPLAGMELSAGGFAELAGVCLRGAEGAARGRAVFALEGGYDLEAVAESGAAVAGVLLGEPAPPLDTRRSLRLEPLIDGYRRALAPFWPVLEKPA